MEILKVVEILASSKTGWEDAAKNAVAEMGKTVRGIRSVNITNQSALVENGKITEYRVNCNITFTVDR